MPPSSFQSQSDFAVESTPQPSSVAAKSAPSGHDGTSTHAAASERPLTNGITRRSSRNIGCMKPPKLWRWPLGPGPGTPL